jgi:hypothetical protein
MSKDLFFIPLIDRALKSRSPESALVQAFAEIQRRGQQEGFHEGAGQFVNFMDEVAHQVIGRIAPLGSINQCELAVDLAFMASMQDDGASLLAPDFVPTSPEWTSLYESFLAVMKRQVRPAHRATIVLDRDGQILQEIVVDQSSSSSTVQGITPGYYTLALQTGRILWEDTLCDGDLRWTSAFPGRPLGLAAATLEQVGQPSRTISLLNGEVILSVFPGLEHGRLEIKVSRAGRPSP